MQILKPTNKTALVTHRNCLDGTGSAAVFIWAGGLKENIFFRSPSKCTLTASEAEPFDEVWFVDVCPKDLSDPAGGKPWRVLDHHDSNVRRHAPHQDCIFDQEKCGTSLLAMYTGQRDRPTLSRLIDAIEHYDLGRFDAHYSVENIADLASTYSQKEMLDVMIEYKQDIIDYGYYQSRAEAVGAARRISAEKAVSVAYGEEVDGLWFAIAVSPLYWKNDIAQRILDGRTISGRVPDVAVVVDYSSLAVSLRSNGNVNVAIIAEEYGGGGHPRSAGFALSRRAMYELFQGVFG